MARLASATKLMPLMKKVKWSRSPSLFISAAKSVSSCQRSSSVQLSNAMTTNCGGRSTPACAGAKSAAYVSAAHAATSLRAAKSAPRPKVTAGITLRESMQGLDCRRQRLSGCGAESTPGEQLLNQRHRAGRLTMTPRSHKTGGIEAQGSGDAETSAGDAGHP